MREYRPPEGTTPKQAVAVAEGMVRKNEEEVMVLGPDYQIKVFESGGMIFYGVYKLNGKEYSNEEAGRQRTGADSDGRASQAPESGS